MQSSSSVEDRLLLQALRQLLPADAEQWCRPGVRVETGNASEEVLRVAEVEKANLIVVGVTREFEPGGSFTLVNALANHSWRGVSGARRPRSSGLICARSESPQSV